MRIENVRLDCSNAGNRIVADIKWEDCAKPDAEVYFGTLGESSFRFVESIDPFLVGSAVAAAHYGERRIKVDSAVCPQLKEGVLEAVTQIARWRGYNVEEFQIESNGSPAGAPERPPHAAGTMSGGADSLFMFRDNMLNYPENHPGRFKTGIFVYGLDIGWNESDAQSATLESALSAVTQLMSESGIPLIPLVSNVRHLDSSHASWMYATHGSVLASVGHAVAHTVTSMSIASTYDIKHLAPWGSHPMTDPLFSSAALDVRHCNSRHSRLDKVRLIADWPAALKHLRVCTEGPKDLLNCGLCEKCLRTRLELMAVGKLKSCEAFDGVDVQPESLAVFDLGNDYQASCYADVVKPLEQHGHNALAQTIRQKLAKWERQKWSRRGIQGRIKSIARRVLKPNRQIA